VIAKGADFVLAGKYPGLAKRYFNFDFYGLDYYGPCYHRECYDRAVRAGVPLASGLQLRTLLVRSAAEVLWGRRSPGRRPSSSEWFSGEPGGRPSEPGDPCSRPGGTPSDSGGGASRLAWRRPSGEGFPPDLPNGPPSPEEVAADSEGVLPDQEDVRPRAFHRSGGHADARPCAHMETLRGVLPESIGHSVPG